MWAMCWATLGKKGEEREREDSLFTHISSVVSRVSGLCQKFLGCIKYNNTYLIMFYYYYYYWKYHHQLVCDL